MGGDLGTLKQMGHSKYSLKSSVDITFSLASRRRAPSRLLEELSSDMLTANVEFFKLEI